MNAQKSVQKSKKKPFSEGGGLKKKTVVSRFQMMSTHDSTVPFYGLTGF